MKRTLRIGAMSLSMLVVLVAISNSGYQVFGFADREDTQFEYIKEEKQLEKMLEPVRAQLMQVPADPLQKEILANVAYIDLSLDKFDANAKEVWRIAMTEFSALPPSEQTPADQERIKLKVTSDLISAGNALDAEVIEPFRRLTENKQVSPELMASIRAYYTDKKNTLIHQFLNQ